MTVPQMHPQLLSLLRATMQATTQQVLAATSHYTANGTATLLDYGGNETMGQNSSTLILPPSTSFLRYQQTTTPTSLAISASSSSSLSSLLVVSTVSPHSSGAVTDKTTTSSTSSFLELSSSSSSLAAEALATLTALENVGNNFSQSLDDVLAVTPMTLLRNYTWSSTAISSATSANIASSTTSTSITGSSISSATSLLTTSTLTPSVDSYLVGMAWSKALVVAIFMLLILATVVGNTLVILAVLTTRRLRTVTNCFVLNLAITDWLVGTFVMPPAVMVYIVESWRLGWILCDIWISLDVLLCTASILSLCAISLDRYLAVTQPLTYSKNRRTKRLAFFMIFIVWVTALCITCPPFFGWYEPGRRKEGYTVCRYNQNKGYVVFSAMGSFFIPLAVMLYVYLKIGYVLTSRRQRIVRDANSERAADHDIDCDNFLSESEHFQCGPQKFPSLKSKWTTETVTNNGSTMSSKQNSLKCSKCNKSYVDQQSLKHQASFYELVEVSRLSTQIPCTSINCKYGDGTCTPTSGGMNYALAEGRAATLPMQQLHCTDSRTSFSETCLAHAMAQAGKFTSNGQVQDKSQGQMNNGSQQLQQQQHHHSHHHPHHHHHHHHHHRVPMRVSTTKRDSKTAKTLTMVMGGFIACWLPFFVYYLLIPFLPPAAVFEGLMSFFTWVGWVNCAINPFIYAFYNPDFRTAFWRLTCKRICKQKSPPNHVTMFRG